MTELPQELQDEFVLAAHGNAQRVHELLTYHPDLARTARWSRFDESAMDAAAHTGRREIAEKLLAAGAPMTIFAAAALGREGDVAALLDAGDQTADARGIHDISLLFHAALSGKLSLVELVRRRGASDRAIDEALHASVIADAPDVVEFLLAEGADTDVRNFEGRTPLEAARERGADRAARVLAATRPAP